MSNNIFIAAWKSFRSISGTLFTVGGVLLALVGFFYIPEAKIGWRWVILENCLISLLVVTLIDMVVFFSKEKQVVLPKITNCLSDNDKDSAIDPNSPSMILLMNSSNLYGNDALVSIFYNQQLGASPEQTFERLIGFGRIYVQENARLQVLVLRIDQLQSEIWQKVRNQEGAVLEQIFVKPSTSYANLRGVSLND